MRRDSIKILLLILLAGFCLRVFYSLTLGEELAFPDSVRYDRIASEILSGGGFKSSQTAPAYPLLLAGIYRVFGRSFFAVRLVHALMEAVSIIMVFLLAKATFSERAGLFAAGIFAVYPFFIFFSGLILTETFFIMLLLLLVYFFRRSFEARLWRDAVICGIIGGITILLKPMIFYFIIFALIFKLKPGMEGKADILKRSAAITMLALSTAAPWGIYSRTHHENPRFLAGSNITLYESFNPRATGGPGIELIEITEEMERMSRPRLEKYYREEAVSFIIQNPGRALRLVLEKQMRFWSPVPNFAEYRNLKYGAIGIISFGPVLLLAAWLVAADRRKWMSISYIYLPILFFALLHTVILGSIRYRVPVDPFIIILASGKLSLLIPSPRSRQPYFD